MEIWLYRFISSRALKLFLFTAKSVFELLVCIIIINIKVDFTHIYIITELPDHSEHYYLCTVDSNKKQAC